MKLPNYLTKTYVQKTYGFLGGTGVKATVTSFSKNATTLKAEIDFSNGYDVDIFIKSVAKATRISADIEYNGYDVKFNYLTKEIKTGFMIQSSVTSIGGAKASFQLKLEKDGDFDSFRLFYGYGTETVTVTSSKVNGNLVTFRAVSDGQVIDTATFNLKAYGAYFSKNKFFFDPSKTNALFTMLQLEFQKGAATGADRHDGDLFVFNEPGEIDFEPEGPASFGGSPVVSHFAPERAGSDWDVLDLVAAIVSPHQVGKFDDPGLF